MEPGQWIGLLDMGLFLTHAQPKIIRGIFIQLLDVNEVVIITMIWESHSIPILF